MKKLLSILLALAMILSFSVVSFAQEAAEESVELISEAPSAEAVEEVTTEEVTTEEVTTEEVATEDVATEEVAEEEATDEAVAEEIAEDSATEETATEDAAVEEAPVEEIAVSYTDLAQDDWAYEAIVALTKRGIISGGDDNTVRPGDGVTRQEVAKIILGARGYEVNAELVLEASDAADVADWAKGYVATAIDKGIIKGYEDGTVKPENVVTRAEFATLIVRALSATSEVQGDSFADVSADAWYAADVECAKNLGIVGGYEDGTFKGDNTVTRREAFAMIYRMVTLLDALQQQ